MAQDITFRNDEWEPDGALIAADVEVVLEWSWQDGRPVNIRPYSYIYHDNILRNYETPDWLKAAVSAWCKQNQSKLQQHFDENYTDDESDAEDTAWSRQLYSTLAGVGGHL